MVKCIDKLYFGSKTTHMDKVGDGKVNGELMLDMNTSKLYKWSGDRWVPKCIRRPYNYKCSGMIYYVYEHYDKVIIEKFSEHNKLINGDLLLINNTCDFFKLHNGKWSLICNIKGDMGQRGNIIKCISEMYMGSCTKNIREEGNGFRIGQFMFDICTGLTYVWTGDMWTVKEIDFPYHYLCNCGILYYIELCDDIVTVCDLVKYCDLLCGDIIIVEKTKFMFV